MPFWTHVVIFLNKIAPWLAMFITYMLGKQSEMKAAELATAKKEKVYAQIEAQYRDDVQRMKDGTW
jgi:hypothetical protein